MVRRDEYLADDRVAGFTRWASPLVTGEVPLEHRWQSRNRSFCCTSLYDALVNYRWPENRHALDHRATAPKLQEFRDKFRDIGAIDSCTKQTQFIENAEAVIKWGGIPVPRKLQEWRRMPPSKLHALIEQTKRALDPQTSETHYSRGFVTWGPVSARSILCSSSVSRSTTAEWRALSPAWFASTPKTERLSRNPIL